MIYTLQLEGHILEEIEQQYQRLVQILRVQFARKGPYIAFRTSYVYSLQYVGNTLHDRQLEALI
jgi:hypothetical protein